MAAGLEEKDSFAALTAKASLEIAEAIREGRIKTRTQLEAEKRKIAVKYNLGKYLSNSDLLYSLRRSGASPPERLLQVHPRRGASGIIVITAFSAPFLCPHGTCTFCPGGPPTGTPQSYLPDGPGMKNALGADFDPFVQVRNSLRKYSENGHDVSKIEMIVEGGTFIATPLEYQHGFVKGVYEGLNGVLSGTLEEAQERNESAASRCVGLSIESKPDWCEPHHLDLMLRYGFTRVEVGVQSLRDDVLRLSNRGHTAADSVRAFQMTRDAGLKVVAHMMPGLPGANPDADLGDLRTIFEDPSFRPDMLKIYPTLVVEGTALARRYALGEYIPYDLETSVELLAKMKAFVPPWVRIMRIQREIPIRHIVGGVRAGNLRDLVRARAAERGYSCRCIRCREVALAEPSQFSDDALVQKSERYVASAGTEVFASYEYQKSGFLAGFVRMRLPSHMAHRPELNEAAIVRELKVYGRVVTVGERDSSAWQHRGLGAGLLSEMERMAREEFGVRKLVVTSAVGTRNYYRKFGYERLGPYMAKNLN